MCSAATPTAPHAPAYDAKVAELADAPDLGSGGREAVGVRVPPFAPSPERSFRDQRRDERRAGRSAGRQCKMTTAMKSDVRDVGACRKELTVEIPAAAVDAAIGRSAGRYGRSAKIRGFRPGKAPAQVVRARFRDQILHDVTRDLIPDAIDEAVAEHGLKPVAVPEIRDVEVDDGKPLTFTALFETVPAVDPGDYTAFTLRQTPVEVDDDAVARAIERLRQGQARLEPVTGRGAERGDVVTIDLERRLPDEPRASPEHLQDVRVEIGNDANPPGFDDELAGLRPGAARSFTVTHAGDDAVHRLAGRQASYAIEVKRVQRPVLPDVDDDFARSIGRFDDLAALRTRVRADLRAQVDLEARNEVRQDLLRQLANRVAFEVPEALVRPRAGSAGGAGRPPPAGRSDGPAADAHRLDRVPRAAARVGGRRGPRHAGARRDRQPGGGRGQRGGRGAGGRAPGRAERPHAAGRPRAVREERRNRTPDGGAAAGEGDRAADAARDGRQRLNRGRPAERGG